MTTLETMYPLVVGDHAVLLTASYTPNVSTTISVDSVDAGVIQSAPNTVTITETDDEGAITNLVTVRYGTKTDYELSDLTVREYDTSATLTHTFAVGAKVTRPLNRDDVNAIKSNVTALNTGKVELDTTGTTDEFAFGYDGEPYLLLN